MKSKYNSITHELLGKLLRRLHMDADVAMLLADTPENRKLIVEANAWSAKMTVAQFKKTEEYAPITPDRTGQLMANGVAICEFIQSQFAAKTVPVNEDEEVEQQGTGTDAVDT